MSTPTRIYIARRPDGTSRLVRAANVAQTARHCARELQISVASQDDLVAALQAGIQVETAGEEPAQPEAA